MKQNIMAMLKEKGGVIILRMVQGMEAHMRGRILV